MEYVIGPWKGNRGPWDVIMRSCFVIMGLRKANKGPWNMNREPCKVIMAPRNVICDRVM